MFSAHAGLWEYPLVVFSRYKSRIVEANHRIILHDGFLVMAAISRVDARTKHVLVRHSHYSIGFGLSKGYGSGMGGGIGRTVVCNQRHSSRSYCVSRQSAHPHYGCIGDRIDCRLFPLAGKESDWMGLCVYYFVYGILVRIGIGRCGFWLYDVAFAVD